MNAITNSVKKDLLLYSLAKLQYETEGKTSDNSVIIKNCLSLSLFERDTYGVFCYICEYITANWGKIELRKSKRRKRELDKVSGKYRDIKTKNYNKVPIFDLLNDENFKDYQSLEVHDLVIKDVNAFGNKLKNGITSWLDNFAQWELVDGVSFSDSRKVLYKKMLAFVEMSWDTQEKYGYEMHLDSENFKDINDFAIIHSLGIFEQLWYVASEINVDFFPRYYEKEPKIACTINILPPLLEILKKHQKLETILLETIFDKKYKELRLYQKKESLLIEGTQDFEAHKTKFVDLQKQYPYGIVSAINHWGKVKKYIVKEKIKLDNESSKNKQ